MVEEIEVEELTGIITGLQVRKDKRGNEFMAVWINGDRYTCFNPDWLEGKKVNEQITIATRLEHGKFNNILEVFE